MNSDHDKTAADDQRSQELSPGMLLVLARERAGLSQEQVAKALYMTLSRVKALESDDYRHMAADTFVRGYLRAYAAFVHVDATQVLAAYDKQIQNDTGAPTVAPARIEPSSKPLWQFGLFILLALFVLWLISIWFFDNRQSAALDRPVNLPPQLDLPAINAAPGEVVSISGQASVDALASIDNGSSAGAEPGAAVLMTPEASATTNAADKALNSESIASAVAMSSSSASASASQTTAPISESLALGETALDQLNFSFVDECWLEVSDARGDVLAADLQRPGRELELQGLAPFTVKLGNVYAVKVELNGEPVALTPVPGTKVLSLQLGQ